MLARFRRVADLDRVTSPLPRANADDVLDRQNEDFAVADPPGFGGALDRLYDLRNQLVADNDVELHLRQEIVHVLRGAIELGVAFLTSESLHFAYGDALDADRAEGFFDLVELERLDDGLDLLHDELLF